MRFERRLLWVVISAYHLPMVGGTRRCKLPLRSYVDKPPSRNLSRKNSSKQCVWNRQSASTAVAWCVLQQPPNAIKRCLLLSMEETYICPFSRTTYSPNQDIWIWRHIWSELIHIYSTNFLVITVKPVDLLMANFEYGKICMVGGWFAKSVFPLSQ